MSEIMDRDYKGLPKEYWSKQNYCWYMHDIIISIFHNCMENDLLSTEVIFKNELDAKEFEKADEVIDWLYEHNYEDEANKIVGKRLFHTILADMFNFIYESLNTIEKGKITVSLALLRKPFRDNLLYLEWLLGNPNEIIKMAVNGEINKYAIESKDVDANKKKSIIKLAINEIDNKEYFDILNENVYYDLRYNYDAENSMQRVWNNANHLVTTGKHIKSKEFNFIFLDKEVHLDHIKYYYAQMPHLLFYTYNIVIKLYNKFIRETSDATKIYNDLLIIYKLCDIMGSIKPKEYFNKEIEYLLNFPCEECKKIIKINVDSKEFEEFKNGWFITCPVCKNEILTSTYIFLDDYKEKSVYLSVVK